jgi:16S rRNA (cytosine1402-N4)-methyltransferase
MQLPATGHDPVLLDEVLSGLDSKPGGTIVDCTLGRAGHAKAIVARIAPGGTFVGLDADPRNLEFAQAQLKDAACAVRLFHANFAELPDVLRQVDPQGKGVDGILADLGLSTNQLFDARYGLSFAQDMPLDMRIDPRTATTAADLVNTMREEDFANLLYRLADERFSRRIARKIADARHVSPIKSTEQLADLVRSAIPKRGGALRGKSRSEPIDPATRTFMALRMAVNDELPNLTALLERAPRALKPGGRFAVISFHSTEDRMVKLAFRSAEQTGQLKVITKKPLSPADDELARNPRSRSAKLRIAERP